MSTTAHQNLIAGCLIPCPKCNQHNAGLTLRLEPGALGIRARLICRGCGHKGPATKWHPTHCKEMCQEVCHRWNSEDNILTAHGRRFEFDVLTEKQIDVDLRKKMAKHQNEIPEDESELSGAKSNQNSAMQTLVGATILGFSTVAAIVYAAHEIKSLLN